MAVQIKPIKATVIRNKRIWKQIVKEVNTPPTIEQVERLKEKVKRLESVCH